MVNVMMAVRRALDKVGVRFAVVIAIALLPLTIVSVVRSQNIMDAARTQSEASLEGETLRAVSSELTLIENAKGAAAALAQVMPQLLLSPDTCNAAMQQLVASKPFSFAGYYDLTGFVPCSNADTPFRFAMNPDLQDQIADPRPTVLLNRDAPVTGASVIYASTPVFESETNTLIGFVGVSVPHNALASAAARSVDDVVFLTLNGDGLVLTSSDMIETAVDILPAQGDITDYLDRNVPFTQLDQTGVLRTYAVIPVLDGRLFALGSWPEAYLNSGNFYLNNPAFSPF